MKIYHIAFSKVALGLSGGEKSVIELVRYFSGKHIENILLTTDNAKQTYEKVGITEGPYVHYKVINSYKNELRFGVLLSYVLRVFQAIKLVGSLSPEDQDVLMCHTNYFPDFVPFYFLTKKNTKTKLYYWFHLLTPHLFRNYAGEFTGQFHLPDLSLLFNKLNEIFYIALTPKRGTIITVNSYYRSILQKKYKGNAVYVIKRVGGIKHIASYSTIKDTYDLIWMGRIHAQKGILEVPKILQYIKTRKPNIQIILMGDARGSLKEQFLETVQKADLQKNITFAGFVHEDKKIAYIKSAKIFLMTSYYESFGLVNLEAMTYGLPVVAYDLPVFAVFEKGMVKVPILDNEKMADEIIRLLEDKKYYDKIANDAKVFANEFSWDIMGKEIYQLITK